MTTVQKKVIDDALALPVDIRLKLIDQLLTSVNTPTSSEIDRLWAEEAERRVMQIRDGDVELIPGEEVFRKIWGKLG